MSAEAEKAVWRSRLLAERRRLSPTQLATAARKLTAHLTGRLAGLTRIAAYVPIGAEPGSVDLLDALHERGTVVLLPVVRPNHELSWAAYGGPDSLVAGPSGLREPGTEPLAAQVVEPTPLPEVEAVVVPALGVDHRGTRLGRGAGYYDRALSRVPSRVPVVALLHDGELVARLPADPWDRPVTAVVTPTNGWTNLPLMPHHSG